MAISVAAKFKCPYLCKVEMSVVVVRWECGNRRSLAITKDCGKGGRPDSFIVRSSMLSIRPSFPPLLIFARVFDNRSSHCWAAHHINPQLRAAGQVNSVPFGAKLNQRTPIAPGT